MVSKIRTSIAKKFGQLNGISSMIKIGNNCEDSEMVDENVKKLNVALDELWAMWETIKNDH